MTPTPSANAGKRVYAPRMPIAERRAQILGAAVEEYLDKGFTGARIDSIAAAIGVSKPVLYGVFESKDEISAAVVEEVHRQEAFGLVDAGALGAYEPLREGLVTPLFESIFAFAAENPRICRFLYSDFQGAPPEAVDFHEHAFEMRSGGVSYHLNSFFGRGDDSDARCYLAATVISITGRRGMLQVANGEFDDTAWLAREYGGMIERGIRST